MKALCFRWAFASVLVGCAGSKEPAQDASIEQDATVVDGARDASSVDASIGSEIRNVATGEYATYYLVDGVDHAYGMDNSTLGYGDTATFAIPPVPIDVPEGLRFVDVQGGLHQSLAVDVEGRVWTWGGTENGLRGDGTIDGDGRLPQRIEVDVEGDVFDHVVSVHAATRYNAVLKEDRSLWLWGDLSRGIAGDGTDGAVTSRPKRVPDWLPDGVMIAAVATGYTLMVLASDGTVWSWGAHRRNRRYGDWK